MGFYCRFYAFLWQYVFLKIDKCFSLVMFPDMNLSERAADFLVKSVNEQSLEEAFYSRMSSDGKPCTTYPEDQSVFCVIKRSAANQLYFFCGYPAAFLALAYLETRRESYLVAAKQILDFCLQCDASIYKFHFAHKVAWAASIVASVTKDVKYEQLSSKIADYLLSLQADSGLFLAEGDPMDKYDQSAEIALWLRDIAYYLSQI